MVACDGTSKEIIKSSSLDSGKKNLPYISEELHKIKPANLEKIREINESTRKKFKELAKNKFGKDIELAKFKIEEKMKEVKKEKEEKSEHNILIACFSATGSTRGVANYISEALDADIFEITPVNPYTLDDLDWNNEESRVSKEYNDETLRDVELTTTKVANWEEYDVVILGYPIWWGISAWPMDSFVKANDFSDKIVIPYCTSMSSRLGDSAKQLEEVANTGDWKSGYRFQSVVSEDEVLDWVYYLNKNIL